MGGPRCVDADHAADEPIDLVVNNAGFGTSGVFHELDVDRLERRDRAQRLGAHHAQPRRPGVMVPRGRGYLLNVSSVASFQPAPGLAVYAATKAYVTSLTESLHEEVRRQRCARHRAVPGPDAAPSSRASATPQRYATTYPDFVWTAAERSPRPGSPTWPRTEALSVPGALYKGIGAATASRPGSSPAACPAWRRA